MIVVNSSQNNQPTQFTKKKLNQFLLFFLLMRNSISVDSTTDPALVDSPIPSEHFCDNKNDGNYAIRDVFKYVLCNNGKMSLKSCDTYDIFAPAYGKCIASKYVNTNNFCKARENGNWANPWNCPRYFYCYNQVSTMKVCQIGDWVYDPYRDHCVPKNYYKCTDISSKYNI